MQISFKYNLDIIHYKFNYGRKNVIYFIAHNLDIYRIRVFYHVTHWMQGFDVTKESNTRGSDYTRKLAIFQGI